MKTIFLAMMTLVFTEAFGYEYTASPNAFDGKKCDYRQDDTDTYHIAFIDGKVHIDGFGKVLNGENNTWTGSGSGDDKLDDCIVTVASPNYDIKMTIHQVKTDGTFSITSLKIDLKSK